MILSREQLHELSHKSPTWSFTKTAVMKNRFYEWGMVSVKNACVDSIVEYLYIHQGGKLFLCGPHPNFH